MTAAPSATRAAAASHGTTDSRKGGSRRKAVAAVAPGGGGSAFLSTVKLQQARAQALALSAGAASKVALLHTGRDTYQIV